VKTLWNLTPSEFPKGKSEPDRYQTGQYRACLRTD